MLTTMLRPDRDSITSDSADLMKTGLYELRTRGAKMFVCCDKITDDIEDEPLFTPNEQRVPLAQGVLMLNSFRTQSYC